MKIDQDLRAAINAAAKAQPDRQHDAEAKMLAKCVDEFLKKKPTLRKKVETLIEESNSLSIKQTAVSDKLVALLDPVGLRVRESEVRASFYRDMDDENSKKFVAAGGKLPPPSERKWKAETVIARLAAAEPKNRDAILKEYGINWS